MTTNELLSQIAHWIPFLFDPDDKRLELLEKSGNTRLWIADAGTSASRNVGLIYFEEMDAVAVTCTGEAGALFERHEIDAIRAALHAALAPREAARPG